MKGDLVGGKYRVIRRVRAGGMGVVFEASHVATGRRVALKVITSDLSKHDQVMARFEREVRAAGTIESEHIVQVFDAGHDDASDRPYMVMEFLDGEDLQQVSRRLGAVPPDLVLRIIAQTCRGLAKAHARGIIHRDIKPGNLFLAKRDGGDLLLKILDFGIAKVKMDHLQTAEEGGLTRTGTMLGSPHYMSPEQAVGLKTMDHRTDIWSVGVVAYKLLAGRTPHQGDSLGRVILEICSQPVPPVQRFAPWVERDVAAVIHRALRVDPDARYQTTAEMLAAVERLLPNGAQINESMLISLGEKQREHVAILDETLAADAANVDKLSPTVAGHVSRTEPGLSRPSLPPGRASPRFAQALVTVGTLALLGWAGWSFRSRLAAVTPTPSLDAASNASAGLSSAAPPRADPELAAPERSVRLVVSPPGASVEVDDHAAEVKDGAVTISGPLGAIRRVRVWLGANEAKSEVAITEQGALPPQIELRIASAKAPSPAIEPPHAGRPSGGTPAASSSAKRPVTKPIDTAVHDTFE